MTTIFMLAIALISFVLGCSYQNHKDKDYGKIDYYPSAQTVSLLNVIINDAEKDKRDWLQQKIYDAINKESTRIIAERIEK